MRSYSEDTVFSWRFSILPSSNKKKVNSEPSLIKNLNKQSIFKMKDGMIYSYNGLMKVIHHQK